MRRAAVIAIVTASLVLAVPSSVLARKPPIAVNTATVTATGGTWPNCSQDVTVTYGALHRVKGVRVYAWQDRCPYVYEFINFDAPSSMTGTVTIHMQTDYSLFERWGWTAALLDARGRWLTPYQETTRYTFTPGICPTHGVIATYP